METKPEKKVILIGGIECPPELEEKFNKWYEEIHIPILLRSGEIEKVTRSKRINDDNKYPNYLMIYEFASIQAFERYEKSQQKAEATAEMKQSWSEGGCERRWRAQYEVIGTFMK